MRAKFIIAVIAASSFVYLAGAKTPPAFAAENSALKAEISSSLNKTVLVSKVTLGGRAIAPGYQTDWPVITIVNAETGNVTYRVESGFVRFDVGQREMRQHFAPGSRFHVSSVDLKDDRLELTLEGGSGNSAKVRLVFGHGWQSNLDINAVINQLWRVFDMPNAPVSSPNTASATEGNRQQTARTAPQTGDAPLRLDSTVIEGNLLQKVAPLYALNSPIGIAARAGGTVVLDVLIGTDGSIQSATFVSGPDVLIQSSIDAVKKWKYRPFLVNGTAVEVESKVNVVFSLGEGAPSQQNQAATQATAEPVKRELTCDDDWVQVAVCKKWAADTEHVSAYCRERHGILVSCAKVLVESYSVCKGENRNGSDYCSVTATKEEAEVANRVFSAENERQRQIQESEAATAFAQRERDTALLREKESRAREVSVAADKASAAKHTTRYRGMYIGELPENAPIKESGCSTDDWSGPARALERIGAGKSTSECIVIVSTDDNRAIDRIIVFTRTPFIEEYRALVAQYGSPLPGQYKLVDGDVPDSIAWHTKDGTQIAEKPDTLRERDNPGDAIPYTIIVYSSQ